MANVIFLTINRFNKRDYHRYGIELFKQKGFDTEIWELTPYINAHYYEEYEPPDLYTYGGHYVIHQKEVIEKKLKNLGSHDIVVSFLGINPKINFIYTYLKSRRVRFCIPKLGAIPIEESSYSSEKRNLISKIWESLKKGDLFEKVAAKFRKNLAQEMKVPPPDFLLLGGRRALSQCEFPVNSGTEYIKVHSMDYDRYLELEGMGKAPVPSSKFAVFLDEFLPYHPDFIRTSSAPPENAESYYEHLNQFFSAFEDVFGLDVVICPHPRATYSSHFNPFDGRKLAEGETIELVRNAECVLGHNSTAFNFAVIYNTPAVMLYHTRYEEQFKLSVLKRAEIMGANAINIENFNASELGSIFGIDKDAYSQYFCDFIKEPGTAEEISWNIFIDHISK